MSMVPCKECGESISSQARICPKCGAKQRMHPLGKAAIGVVVLFVGFLSFGFIIGPKNDEERHAKELAKCIDNRGEGQWQYSAGMSLQQFCETLASIKVGCHRRGESC